LKSGRINTRTISLH